MKYKTLKQVQGNVFGSTTSHAELVSESHNPTKASIVMLNSFQHLIKLQKPKTSLSNNFKKPAGHSELVSESRLIHKTLKRVYNKNINNIQNKRTIITKI